MRTLARALGVEVGAFVVEESAAGPAPAKGKGGKPSGMKGKNRKRSTKDKETNR